MGTRQNGINIRHKAAVHRSPGQESLNTNLNI